ncbi:hypothetical protein [Aquibacillus saliphilus]|uniref:hypothetical protein n=1 Tax=Aquibacillus saliphilus TaxID=1909422 RepID=UPI001CF049C8|nr:hypothetical protein [Aquibacillus saliphilus]
MKELTDAKRQMLRDYNGLLSVMTDGFDYLESNLNEETLEQTDVRVFNDLLASFEQLNKCHQQMTAIFSDNKQFSDLIEEFKEIIKLFSECFTTTSSAEKKDLLSSKVIPAFERFKQQMEQLVAPHITH